MIKNIEVVEYNCTWPKMFELEAKEIKKNLGEYCLAVFHIGSTAVPGLAAKPKIDIIAVVKDLSFSDNILLNYKYRGGFNLPFHRCFTKRSTTINVNLHVFEENNPEIELNLIFRNYLRNNTAACDEYAKLKLNLLKSDTSFKKDNNIFSNYNLCKDEFIRKILEKAAFQGLCLKFCTHHNEWENYRRMKNCSDEILISENHFHFVLYKGVEVVSAAHIEYMNDTAILRFIAADNKNFEIHMLQLLKKYVKSNRNTYRINKI